MRRDVHIAIPRKHRPAGASRRQPAQPVIDHRNRLDHRQLDCVLVIAPTSAMAKNDVRNGSTRDPSELVPSGNRIRLSPPSTRRAWHRAPCPVEARLRDTKTVRPRRAIVPITGQVATSRLGDETAHQHTADDRDIDPGRMVRHIDHRPAPAGPSRKRRANDPDLDTDQPCEHRPVKARERTLRRGPATSGSKPGSPSREASMPERRGPGG